MEFCLKPSVSLHDVPDVLMSPPHNIITLGMLSGDITVGVGLPHASQLASRGRQEPTKVGIPLLPPGG